MRLDGGHESHPLADLFPMMLGAELDALAQSMRTRGFDPAEPIVRLIVREKAAKKGARAIERKLILDGRNRLVAATKVGIALHEKRHFSDHALLDDGTAEGLGDIVAYVIGRNIARRHLDETQRSDIAARLATLPLGANQHTKSKAPSGGSADLRTQPITTAQAATLLNVSPRSVEAARQVHRTAVPEVREEMQRGRLSVHAAVELAKKPPEQQKRIYAERVRPELERGKPVAATAIRGMAAQIEKRDISARLEKEPPPLPTGQFRTIVSDPPWPYEARSDDPTQRAQMPYPPMSIDEICALPVHDRAHPDGCVLWLWTTNAFMEDAYRVLRAWGFEPKTILTWVKEKLGAGHYLRNTTEHCILAVSGKKPIINGERERTDLRGELREHSRKPETFYELVDRSCRGSKLEMFSRTAREGWVLWGAETGKFAPDAQTRLRG